MNAPCYQCPKRCLLCHAHCKEYADWAEETRKKRQRPQAECEIDAMNVGLRKRIRRAQQADYSKRCRR